MSTSLRRLMGRMFDYFHIGLFAVIAILCLPFIALGWIIAGAAGWWGRRG